MPDITRVHVVIHGRVQGVGFRYSCAEMARACGLTGWVRNLPVAAVEAVFEGGRDDVDAAVDWCRSGPAWASVSSVDVTEESPEGDARFQIR
ncbi:acylphosphatase [Humibacter antri]